MRIQDPKTRFKAVWELCKTRTVCEQDDDEMDEDREHEDGDEDDVLSKPKKKHRHGGCGRRQPTLRKEGLKLYATQRSTSKDPVWWKCAGVHVHQSNGLTFARCIIVPLEPTGRQTSSEARTSTSDSEAYL
jgi:hypothetical protein